MKKIIKLLTAIVIFMFTSLVAFGQDFTVKVESTEKYTNLLPPVKAGGSLEFDVSVKSNRSDTVTVYMVIDDSGEPQSWVTVEDDEMVFLPQQEQDFELTVNVPSYAGDYNFDLPLNFKFKDKELDSDYETFSGTSQVIIVDNSAPQEPTFSVSTSSYTVHVYNWRSYDTRSSFYTTWNPESGIEGIKSYTVTLKNANGETVGTPVTKLATDYNVHTFSSLYASTEYKVSVKATDLAGNSKSFEKSATTNPAPPTNLMAINKTYFGFTLKWDAMPGATSYEVYQITSE